MELNYRFSESTERPEQVQVGYNTVYLRKDIKESKTTDEDGITTVYYTYQEAPVPLDEFNRNASAFLISNQMDGDSARLTMMEALADLYESLMTLNGGI